jgi:hypothetical protein
LRFAALELKLDAFKSAIFINIMWHVLSNGDSKYDNSQNGAAKGRSAKDREADLKLFKTLLQ